MFEILNGKTIDCPEGKCWAGTVDINGEMIPAWYIYPSDDTFSFCVMMEDPNKVWSVHAEVNHRETLITSHIFDASAPDGEELTIHLGVNGDILTTEEFINIWRNR